MGNYDRTHGPRILSTVRLHHDQPARFEGFCDLGNKTMAVPGLPGKTMKYWDQR
jgi:hypothetical protein